MNRPIRAILRAIFQPTLLDKPDARAMESLARLEKVIEERQRDTTTIQEMMNQIFPPEGR